MSLALRPLRGPDLDAALDDLARLRIAVFRDWPYIYEGSLDYERAYLESYRASAGGIAAGVAAWKYSLLSLWTKIASGRTARIARMAETLARTTCFSAVTKAPSLASCSFHQP